MHSQCNFLKKDTYNISNKGENKAYLRTQLITYIGNKRLLLPFLDKAIVEIKKKLKKNKISFLDLFSGSGIVARSARQHASTIICNDLELYSRIINSCYQTDYNQIDVKELRHEIQQLDTLVKKNLSPGFITDLYAPSNDEHIKQGERVFYTRKNAVYLDTFCQLIKNSPSHLYCYFMAPLLSQASMHTNTSGVFKGFYKNKNGIGQFGGNGRNALSRIKKNISLQIPVFSNFSCESYVYQEDANTLVNHLENIDIAYFDPPYNQHPYGSNYFMLNLLCDYKKPVSDILSKVSGIPSNWKRSNYNKRAKASVTLFNAIENVKAKFVLISYSSDGFITHEDFVKNLRKLGKVSYFDQRYNTFRGCRNLSDRNIHVTEFLYMLDKR